MASPRLLQRLEVLESERAEIVGLLRDAGPELSSFSPPDGAWSPLQVAAHLVHAETLSLASIRKRLDRADRAPSAGLAGRFRSLLLKLVLRSGKRVKAPDIVAEAAEDPELEPTIAAWDGARAGWRELFEEIPEEWAPRALYKHPIAGVLSLAGALEFQREHVLHHRPQIVRRLAEARRVHGR